MDSDKLMHYGVKGMKWGVRRDLKSPRSYTKHLNKLDKQYANNASKYIRNDYKHNKIKKEAIDVANAHAQYPTKYGSKKLSSLIKKGERLASKTDLYQKNMKEIESEQWKAIGNATEKGYNVSNTPKMRTPSSHKAASYIATLCAGPIGAMSVATLTSIKGSKYKNEYPAPYNDKTIAQNPYAILGNKFKVKKRNKNS